MEEAPVTMDGVPAGAAPYSPPPPAPHDPETIGLAGPWRIGHAPQGAEDWALETRLRVTEVERPAEWATGRRPESEREWQLEYSFRELENITRTQQVRLGQEAEANLQMARESMRSTNVRSWVLLAIVSSIIVMPVIAMAIGVAAQSFSQYIAPITGIAGTVLGYWFSQQGLGGFPDRRSKDQATSSPAQSSGFPSPPLQP